MGPVNELLDDLDQRRHRPEMRNVLRLESGISISATPRAAAGSAFYRITWTYTGDEEAPFVLCLTVADSTIRRSP